MGRCVRGPFSLFTVLSLTSTCVRGALWQHEFYFNYYYHHHHHKHHNSKHTAITTTGITITTTASPFNIATSPTYATTVNTATSTASRQWPPPSLTRPAQVHPSVGVAALDPNVGWDPADPAFARVRRHRTAEIAWLEDDPGLSVPQLWVNRTLTHAAEAARYGVAGLFGLLWRTAETAPQLAALSAAAWGAGPDVASATEAPMPPAATCPGCWGWRLSWRHYPLPRCWRWTAPAPLATPCSTGAWSRRAAA